MKWIKPVPSMCSTEKAARLSATAAAIALPYGETYRRVGVLVRSLKSAASRGA